VLRETAIAHIPVEAGDGYYRLVLCADATKKVVLCPSPVFGLMSMTTRPSSIRGASLSTLLLEVGARALSGAAKAAWDFSGAAGRAAGKAERELRGADLVYELKRDEVFGTSGYEYFLGYRPTALFPTRFIGKVNF
jgi:hypothetical protein